MAVEPQSSSQLWRREARRQSLLQALDIPLLSSRFDPPGAARAVRYPAPQRHDQAPVQRKAQINPQARHTRRGDPASLASPVRPATGSARTTTSPQQLERTAEPPVSFSLLIASAGAWLWVEHLENALVAQEQLQLLQAMAQALSGPEARLAHRQFDWPLPDAPQLPRDLESARQSVAGQLARWSREQAAHGLILCGERAGDYATPWQGCKSVVIPAVSAMLQQPLLKREAWKLLHPLQSG